MPCKEHPHWRYFDADFDCCTACGALRPVTVVVVKQMPAKGPKIKPPIGQEEAEAAILANLDRIKKMRASTMPVSFREIVKRLNLNMTFSTLQKHYSRILEGAPMGKRGRKAV